MISKLMPIFTAAVVSISGASAGYPEFTKNYYGYDINLGGIAGTDMAEELNSHKDEILKYLNGLADDYENKYNIMFEGEMPLTALDRLKISDIDFNSEEKISTFRAFYIYDYDYYKNDLTYDEFLKKYSELGDDICWEYYIYKNNTTYTGTINYNEPTDNDWGLKTGDFRISDLGVFSEEYFGDGLYEDRYLKENTAEALKGADEKSTDIDAAYVAFDYDSTDNKLIIFTDGKAKYVADTSFAAERAMCTYLRDDTPGPVRKFLSQENEKLKKAAENKSGDFALYPYNDLMKIVRASLPWAEEDYLDNIFNM